MLRFCTCVYEKLNLTPLGHHTTPLVSVLFFYSSIPTFCSLFKMFFIHVPVLFCNYILCIKLYHRVGIDSISRDERDNW